MAVSHSADAIEVHETNSLAQHFLGNLRRQREPDEVSKLPMTMGERERVPKSAELGYRSHE